MLPRLYSDILICLVLLTDLNDVVTTLPIINGRYTRNIENFVLILPYKSTNGGDFITFKLPNFYSTNRISKNDRIDKRDLNNPDMVNYIINLNDVQYQTDLWPNYNLLSPNAISENYQPKLRIQNRHLRQLNTNDQCYYIGNIRNVPDSKVALSTCHGLAGYIQMNGKRYFIEPIEEHSPNHEGQYLHIIHERYSDNLDNHMGKIVKGCGTNTDWESAWTQRFYNQFLDNDNSFINDEKRSMVSVHRYLETLVVCDKKFLEHHKNIDYETYVLTIMNMVADYYHDASSGNQMDVVVVRIMYLEKEEEEIDLSINQNAEDTLASFCKWQAKINPTDLSNPNHHDIAVLLTRYDICSDNLSNCGLMGLAYVATACTKDENCAINEDGGLVLGIVVAHEMGHVMGCAHDKEGESECPAQDKDESYFVMAPFVHIYTTKWSTCSRAFITSLFENNLGECLNDEPEISLYKDRNLLPGSVYDADEQCRILFPNSRVCRINDMTFCEVLYCQTSATSCSSNNEPPADGTKCGENMWCYRKKCVEIGERPEAINGGWSEWGSWSKCSRTCGGGVQISSRDCTNPVPAHRGRYCLGERKRIKICNMEQCPEGTPSYRETQCMSYNKEPFQGKLYQWKTYIKEDEPCVLYCLNNENVYAKLAPRAKDGTPCKKGTKDMCISGVCRKIGCDNVLDSDSVEDICGVCNGDGTGCTVIDEIYKKPPGKKYTKIVEIPTGSRNILIEELSSSVNTIAISDNTEKKFYLNGNFQEEADGDKNFGKTVGIYAHTGNDKERLFIHGPLTENLIFFVVFYRPENVGYRYKYSIPSSDHNYTPKYHWEQFDWTDCPVRCGGGIQEALYSCVEEKSGKVADKFCKSLEKPELLTKSCNQQSCQIKWKTGKWSQCFACKFKSGVRIRQVQCVKESPHPGTEDILVEDAECKEPKPGTRELCNSHKKCKLRRFTDGLPDDMMENIWMQIYKIKRQAVVSSSNKKRSNDKRTCQSNNVDKKFKVGDIIKDHIPDEDIKVIQVPIKESHPDLPDDVFETMGDKIADNLDVGQVQISSGKKGADILKNLQHNNQTLP